MMPLELSLVLIPGLMKSLRTKQRMRGKLKQSWTLCIGIIVSSMIYLRLVTMNISKPPRLQTTPSRTSFAKISSFREYEKHLKLAQSHLDSLLDDTTSTLDLLSSLSKSFQTVEAQTISFQKQCEGILEEQNRMVDLANSFEKNLKYYNFLEPVTRRLNAPGAGSFVRSKEFSEMLSRLDDCLEYMIAHVSVFTYLLEYKSDVSAISSRSSYLPFTLSFIADKRIDIDPRSLRRRLAGDCVGCYSADC